MPRGISNLYGSLQPSEPTTDGLLAHQALGINASGNQIQHISPNVMFLLWLSYHCGSCGTTYPLSFIFPTFRGVLSFSFMLELSQNSAYKRFWCVKNKLFAYPVLKYEIDHGSIGSEAKLAVSSREGGVQSPVGVLIKVFLC
jgi:hypothetical protein